MYVCVYMHEYVYGSTIIQRLNFLGQGTRQLDRTPITVLKFGIIVFLIIPATTVLVHPCRAGPVE